jgi:hypothetical protein
MKTSAQNERKHAGKCPPQRSKSPVKNVTSADLMALRKRKRKTGGLTAKTNKGYNGYVKAGQKWHAMDCRRTRALSAGHREDEEDENFRDPSPFPGLSRQPGWERALHEVNESTLEVLTNYLTFKRDIQCRRPGTVWVIYSGFRKFFQGLYTRFFIIRASSYTNYRHSFLSP